jgi:two-component system, NtrC family, sensor histidine kinase PilS
MIPTGLLRWVYLARLSLAAGIFVAALVVWTQPAVTPETTLIATLVLVAALGFTAGSFWYTHIAGSAPGRNFLSAQVLFDAVLVTAVVHVTGGGQSELAMLYVLVIAEGAMLLPLVGGFLSGALVTLLYLADARWGGTLTAALGGVPMEPELGLAVLTRAGLFVVLTVVTVLMAERARRAGTQLGAIQSELRQLRLDTTDILGALDTGVLTVDSEGSLVYANEAAERLLGLRARDWLGRPSLEEMDRVVPGLSWVVNRTLTTGRPVNRYQTHGRSGGEMRVFGVRTTTLEREGDPWVTVVMQDITAAHQGEAARRRAERLEAVGELAASLAHEIKNPLASIRSAVEQLTGGSARLRDADRDVLGRLVLAESDRLSRLLSGFIEFSGVQLRQRRTVDLVRVAREAVELVRQHPDARTGAGVELDGDGPVEVEGDPDLLHRAVFNLVLNAVQHTEDGSDVRVDVAPATPGAIPSGTSFSRGARLRVTDRGPGIRAEDVSRVFDPFFTTREGGSGLGLALVHRAIEAHKGVISIDSEEGRGTTFTVFLPAQQPVKET